MARRLLQLDTKDIAIIVAALKKSNVQDSKLLKKLESSLKQIKHSSGKGKGRNLQMWVCENVSRLIGIPYDQQDDQCLIHSREMGLSGVDVILRGEAQRRFPYNIECKNTENIKLAETVLQARANTVEPYDWMIIHKRKVFLEPIVIITWSAFAKLFERGINVKAKR